MGWIVVLVILWAGVLLPRAIKDWSHTSPVSSVERFERAMSMLARSHPPASGRRVLVPDQPEEPRGGDKAARAAQRRRLVLTRLMSAVVSGGAVGLLLGGWFWSPFVLTVVALAAYLALMFHFGAGGAERNRTVDDLEAERRRLRPPPPPAPDSAERVVAEFEHDGSAVRIVRWDR